jgi:hypothetical protein
VGAGDGFPDPFDGTPVVVAIVAFGVEVVIAGYLADINGGLEL